jgi:hypothetical protein
MWARRRRKFLARASLRHSTAAAYSLIDYGPFLAAPIFLQYLDLFLFVFIFWCYEDGLDILKEWMYNTPIF